MQIVFDRANLLFDQVLANLVCPYDIDFQKIKAEARETVLNMDGLTSPKNQLR